MWRARGLRVGAGARLATRFQDQFWAFLSSKGRGDNEQFERHGRRSRRPAAQAVPHVVVPENTSRRTENITQSRHTHAPVSTQCALGAAQFCCGLYLGVLVVHVLTPSQNVNHCTFDECWSTSKCGFCTVARAECGTETHRLLSHAAKVSRAPWLTSSSACGCNSCLAVVPKVSQLFRVPQQANHGTPLVTLAAEAGTSEAEFLVAGVPPRPAGAALVDDWDCLRVGRRICQRLSPMCIGKSIAAWAQTGCPLTEWHPPVISSRLCAHLKAMILIELCHSQTSLCTVECRIAALMPRDEPAI